MATITKEFKRILRKASSSAPVGVNAGINEDESSLTEDPNPSSFGKCAQAARNRARREPKAEPRA